MNPGDIVQWHRNGAPEHGVVEGIDGPTIVVRRIDGPPSTHSTRLPKTADDLTLVVTAARFVDGLRAQADHNRAHRRTPPEPTPAPGPPPRPDPTAPPARSPYHRPTDHAPTSPSPRPYAEPAR